VLEAVRNSQASKDAIRIDWVILVSAGLMNAIGPEGNDR